jgi:hypothetical protein
VERGWENVATRLDWASSKYSDGIRSRNEVSGMVGADFAYIVQTELIRSRLAGRAEQSNLELRVTMVFRREGIEGSRGHRGVKSRVDELVYSLIGLSHVPPTENTVSPSGVPRYEPGPVKTSCIY